MKASELRIGNYIKYSEDGVIFTIGSIDEKGYTVQNDEETTWIEEYEFESIPLTEEWLLKLGFTRHHADYFNDVIYIKNVPNNNEFEWGLYPNKIGSGIQVKNGKLLKYVHQLQNLYFSLTGEELTIN